MVVPPSILGDDLGAGLQDDLCRGPTVKGIARLVGELTGHFERAGGGAGRDAELVPERHGALVVRAGAVGGRFGRWVRPRAGRLDALGPIELQGGRDGFAGRVRRAVDVPGRGDASLDEE